MPANFQPTFALTPNLGLGGGATAANTRSDGNGTIGTDIFKVFTAGSNGSVVPRVQFLLAGLAANTASTATVARVFASSQTSGATTSANTILLGEVTLPALTAASSTAANGPYYVNIAQSAIPASWTILVTNHAAPAANTLWVVSFPGAGDL